MSPVSIFRNCMHWVPDTISSVFEVINWMVGCRAHYTDPILQSLVSRLNADNINLTGALFML